MSEICIERLSVARLKPGDIVVVQIKGRHLCREIDRITAGLMAILPDGVKAVVIDEDALLDVYRPIQKHGEVLREEARAEAISRNARNRAGDVQ